MREKVLSLIGLLLFAVGCLEASAQNGLVVETNDGMTYSYVLAEKPRLSFNETDMVITSADADASFNRTDIKNFRFEDVETGIAEINANGQRMTYLNGIVTIEGNGVVGLYDTAGRQLMSSKAVKGENVSIDMNVFPKGTYIVRCGKQSIKIKK